MALRAFYSRIADCAKFIENFFITIKMVISIYKTIAVTLIITYFDQTNNDSFGGFDH